MMAQGLTSAVYIAASILFILSLGGLSNQESARRGNLFGIAGMAIAIFATCLVLPLPVMYSFSALWLWAGLQAAPSPHAWR